MEPLEFVRQLVTQTGTFLRELNELAKIAQDAELITIRKEALEALVALTQKGQKSFENAAKDAERLLAQKVEKTS